MVRAKAETVNDDCLCGMPHKRRRRTRQQIIDDQKAIWSLVNNAKPATVRQVFYLAEVNGIVPKTESGYDQVGRDLLSMRRCGALPYSWITDATRWMRKPATYSGVEEALLHVANTYRRALWDDQLAYVEVWIEKDTVAGVLISVTREYDVPLMVSRGFSSDTYLYETAQNLIEQGKPVFIYYFGDHDPSGVWNDKVIERKLRGFAPDADITFERVAVTPAQIDLWSLTTRPTKRAKNSHAKAFSDNRSVELEAIAPDRLRQIARSCIERHIDHDQLEITRAAERSERDIFTRLNDLLPHLTDTEGGDENA